MDITQLYIQQQLGDNVKPWYSQTFFAKSKVVGLNSVIDINLINEKVKLILCSNLWISYNTVNAPIQIRDVFNQLIFETPIAPINTTQQSIMFVFPYIQEGAAIKFSANNVNFNFTLLFQKVFLFNDKA
jgi:hypothetical protein